jgi:hypothetical protein
LPPNRQTLQVIETKALGCSRWRATSRFGGGEGAHERRTDLHEEASNFVSLTMPFVAVEISSGMGKAPMASNLATTNLREVFYVLCSPSSEKYQSVHAAFEARRETLKRCIDMDMTKLDTGAIGDFQGVPSLLLHNFIACAPCGGGVFHEQSRRRGSASQAATSAKGQAVRALSRCVPPGR